MKKIYFGAVFTLMSFLISAQEDYDHWSIDIGGGVHEIGSPLTPGFSENIFGQAHIGYRYMFNERFGLRLDLGYNGFSAENSSKPFKSNYYRASLEGVVNLGNILKFNSWTKRFNLLAHSGIGVASLNITEPTDNGGDIIYVMNAGLTPQFKLTNRFTLFLDVNTFINFHQGENFDGGGPNVDWRESNISLINTSIGLNIALGKNKQSADFWNEDLDDAVMDSELMTLKKRLNTAEQEIAILKTKKSGPNQELIMTELDNRYVKKDEVNKYSDVVTGSNVDFIRSLLNSGYINVYFDVNKTKIQDGSLNSVNYLKQFMLDNPYVNADLIGYADETGKTESNKTLSQNRAKRVYDVLVAAGISPTRLSYFGGGEDKTVTKNARQLARKVTFKIR